jgi:hypothetical protein
MSHFIVRVELHDASRQHYDLLAKDLARKGITDVITSNAGGHYKLPPAEYCYVGNSSIDDVLNAAEASATQTGKRHAVLVSEAKLIKWNGLIQ